MLDHANLVAMASSIGEWMKLGPDDHCLLVLPLSPRMPPPPMK